jgi:hypothetical protein
MADVGGSSAPVNPPGGASNSLTRPSSPSGIALGGGGSGGADPVPAWLKNLSKQLSDNSYPNFFASSSNSKAPDGSPPSSPPRLRKKARYSSPPPATPPPSPTRDPNNDVLPPSWSTTTPLMMSRPVPDPVTLLAANKAPAFVASGRGGALLSPLGFYFRRSSGEQAAAGAREEEVIMTEKNPDEEEGLELTLGNAETRKDRA